MLNFLQPEMKILTKNQSIQQQIHAELVKLLYVQIQPGLLGEIFALSVALITLQELKHFYWFILWYIVGVLNALLRYRLTRQYLAANPPVIDAYLWLKKFFIGVVLSGVVWGCTCFAIAASPDNLSRLCIMLLLIGVSAATSAYYSSFPKIYACFLLLAFMPFTLWLLSHQEFIYTFLGIAAFIFMGLMLTTAYYTHKMLADGLNLRYTNIELLQDLSDAKKNLEEVNKDLHMEIQERKQIQHDLQDLATHDVLTQLPNRALFNERLLQAINHARRNHKKVAVILLDIDNFKKINNTEGHNAGDKLLIKVSERLTNTTRGANMVSRLGGDEFVVLVEDFAGEHEVAAIARRLCEVTAEKFYVDGLDIYISSSAGISVFPTDGDNADTLLKSADLAMYRAKEAGKNNFQFYTPSLHSAVLRKQLIENNLRKAVENEQFIVYYQPFFDLSTKKIIGMEALARWQHPEHGLVSPVQFIPIAEETGLIIPISEWIIRTACLQAKKWEAIGFKNLELGVNLSAKQFSDKRFIKLINNILMETGLASRNLNIEITESMIMADVEHTVAMLKELSQLGVKLSIDDFGTGYSSLSYLKRFPIDVLKIDRSFIADIIRDHDDAMITVAIINLGHSLHLKIIAEGVESIEQYLFLDKNNCDIIQGYLISKPVPGDEFEQLLYKNDWLS